MRVLHVIPSIGLSHGGPSRSSVNLVNGLSTLTGVEPHFYFYKDDNECTLNLLSSVQLHQQKHIVDFKFKTFYADYKRIRLLIRKRGIDLLHIHGVWHPLLHWAARAASVEHVPYIIQPRGMLEPWALDFRRFKKAMAMCFYQKADLRKASGIIATAEQELKAIKSLGISSAFSVIPNGVELPSWKIRRPDSSGLKTALFMSRIHPKKGVIDLIKAWAKVNPHGWRLRIVGPDDGGHLVEVLAAISSLRVGDSVNAIGPLYGDERAFEYSNADLFILPTYSENFGIAIAEALSYGIPVITTTGAPWSTLVDYQCGWWIEPGEDALVNVLPAALAVSDEDRVAMGNRAKKLAARFDWDNVAQQTMVFYGQVLSLRSAV